MKALANWMLGLDRRLIFLLVTLTTLVPLIYPLGLPIRISKEVRGVYDYLDSLPRGSIFLISLDFDPAVKPELYPMSVALLRHAFRKDLKVIGMTLLVTGTGMAEQLLRQAAEEAGKVRGQDYVFLGFKPGGTAVILNMGQDLHAAFPSDHYGQRTADLPLLRRVRTLRDVKYAICVTGGMLIESWYVYGKEKYGFELGGGCTGVVAPGLYPLLQTGQINGLIGGLRGAAEYETLLGEKGKAIAGMDAQSATHFLIIGLILLSNLFYFLRGKR